MEHVNARIIRNKLGLLNLAQELGNVSKACKIMGLSRDTFYRYHAAVEAGGIEALVEKSRRTPNQKNRTHEATEAAVVGFALDYPAHGQVRASNELRKQGVFISPSGVRCVWQRHDLASFKQRLAGLERKLAESGSMVLTEAQVIALERKRDDDVACGEIETAQPGLPRLAGYFLRRYFKGRRTYLPTDLRRHVFEVDSAQALHQQDANHVG
jgi:transposase